MNRLGYVALIAVVAAAAACAASTKNGGTDDGDVPISGDGEGTGALPPPRQPDINNGDAGAFGVGHRSPDGGATEHDAGGRPPSADAAPPPPPPPPPPVDASAPDASAGQDSGSELPDSSTNVPDAAIPDAAPPPPPPQDSGSVTPPGACPSPLAAGNLAVVELMIASQTGAGDHGEWVEIQSTQNCALNLKGVHIESPRGSGVDAVDITSDYWLPANGIFVVADSADASVNHNLPAPPLWTWNSGNSVDVLTNGGDTITITANGATIESFSYPALVLYSGVSISFPADCAWSDRSSFARWSYSSYVWSSPFQGTPNADNTDVACY